MKAPPKVKAVSKSRAASAPKKKYTPPKLETYGSVAEITRAKPGIRADGGSRPFTKI